MDIRGKIDRSVITALSVGLFVFTWTYFGITDDWRTFFKLLPICCFTLYLALLLPVKYRDFYFRVKWVAFFFTFNNLLDEYGDYMFPVSLRPYIFNPNQLQINEYITAIIIITFVARVNRKEWKTVSYAEYFKQITFGESLEKESLNRNNTGIAYNW